ncbi:hypothetical protein KOR42_51880 [Thalassoglobus neptunius]|uniref:Uncharacterized protein n=1 Tax=Thalassoglobus neptunius TaxID=1938619 RepID=A0A5C5VK32_9PLAN|nr:hypothetical protein KOR42_51880 [Thalassoglobus neptunius]
MDVLQYDAILRVTYLTQAEGGRRRPIVLGEVHYGCPVSVNGSYYDCRFLSASSSILIPGHTYEIAVKFLSPNLVLSLLHVGTSVRLRESRDIAFGHVVDVAKHESSD